MEIFQTFAEISIGILGFTAIVIMLKSQHSQWNESVFQGMISHCVQALLYSILPFILEAYDCKPETIWICCSLVLGIITMWQGIMVQIFDKQSKQSTKTLMLLFSLGIGVLMFLNVFGVGNAPNKAPYLIGITWHIVQSLVIFIMIVAKGPSNSSNEKP